MSEQKETRAINIPSYGVPELIALCNFNWYKSCLSPLDVTQQVLHTAFCDVLTIRTDGVVFCIVKRRR